MERCVICIIVIIVRNRIGDQRSNALDKAVGISLCPNALGKGMNASVLPPAIISQTDYLLPWFSNPFRRMKTLNST